MAAIDTQQQNKHAGVKKMAKRSTRVDLTPMVDLGFLLITFFVFTSQMAKPKLIDLMEPYDKDPASHSTVCASCALTLAPGANGVVYYYEGLPENNSVVKTTAFTADGLRTIIQQKKAALEALHDSTKKLVLIIKPGDESTCSNFVDLLDEVLINDVRHYFIAEPDARDRRLMPGLWKQ